MLIRRQEKGGTGEDGMVRHVIHAQVDAQALRRGLADADECAHNKSRPSRALRVTAHTKLCG